MLGVIQQFIQLLIGLPADRDVNYAMRMISVWTDEKDPEGKGAWNIGTRREFAERLKLLIQNPTKLDQAHTSWCYLAAFWYIMLKHDPDRVAEYAMEVFDTGKALTHTIGTKLNAPSATLRAGVNPHKLSHNQMEPVDWLLMATAYETHEGGTFDPSEEGRGANDLEKVAQMFRDSGRFADVTVRRDTFTPNTFSDAKEARVGKIDGKHWETLMLLNITYLDTNNTRAIQPAGAGISVSMHAPVLETRVMEPTTDRAEFKYWSWGAIQGKAQLGEPDAHGFFTKRSSAGDFYQAYYGYIEMRWK